MKYFRPKEILQLLLIAIYIIGTLTQCEKDVLFFKNESLILDSLNGKIKGACNKIEFNDLSNSNSSDYIISWKSKKK